MKEKDKAKHLLASAFTQVREDESGAIRIYDDAAPEEIVSFLYGNGVLVSEIKKDKVGLEEYYTDFMAAKGGKRDEKAQ